jgi:hypothetical protein
MDGTLEDLARRQDPIARRAAALSRRGKVSFAEVFFIQRVDGRLGLDSWEAWREVSQGSSFGAVSQDDVPLRGELADL